MIQLDHVSKVYPTRHGPRLILEDINLRIDKGEKIGIMGRNGSGKSTLIRLIGGAELPTSGKISRGITVSWPLAFGGAFQNSLTGLDNVRFVCRIYNVQYENVLPFVKHFTELGIYLREPLRHYSTGMRARLAFAISMAIEFDCFLIDEIISVGDSNFQEKCRVELFEKRKDRTLILVAHDPTLVLAHCQRALVLRNQKLHSFENLDDACAYYRAS